MQQNAKRQPVVAVVGHVDHGKSSLLDAIRKTNLTEKEAGGITQRVGAYEAAGLSFIDTPGHEAFKRCRECASGAADVAILAVAADEGAKAQTLECAMLLQTSGLPFIVAFTKIDKTNADLERAKQSLAEKEIFVEGYGGNIPFASVSAKTGAGLPELLDLVRLLAELHEKPCHASALAEGFIVEAERSAAKGIFATLIVRDGTLRRGQAVAAGSVYSTLRIFDDYSGMPLAETGCGRVARVGGWSELPRAGEQFRAYKNKKEAEGAARSAAERAASRVQTPTLGQEKQEQVIIPLIVRADTAGSIEAIKHETEKCAGEKVAIRIVRAELGDIGESDLRLAEATDGALVVGFNVGADAGARKRAKATASPFHTFDIIYRLAEFIEEVVKERTPKEMREEVAGQARIVKIFSEEKNIQIAGSKMLAGEINVGNEFRIIRRGERVGTGKIKELQKQNERVREISAPAEFGAAVTPSLPLAPSDIIEVVKMVETG